MVRVYCLGFSGKGLVVRRRWFRGKTSAEDTGLKTRYGGGEPGRRQLLLAGCWNWLSRCHCKMTRLHRVCEP